MRWLLVALFGATLAGCSTPVSVSVLPPKPPPPPVPFAGLVNFDIIDSEYNAYRCAQPTEAAQWDYFQSKDVEYDIKLDTDTEGSDAYAESIGLHVIKYPIDLRHQLYMTKTEEALLRAELIAIIRAHPKHFVVHCVHGQDRTGLYVYLYDRIILGMSKQSAIDDMMSHGFHKLLHGLWEVVEDYP